MKFHLNCHTIGFRPQTQKLRPHYKTPAFSTLAMKGLASRLQLVNNIKSEFNGRSIDDKKKLAFTLMTTTQDVKTSVTQSTTVLFDFESALTWTIIFNLLMVPEFKPFTM